MYPHNRTQATITITGAIALLCTLIWAVHNYTYAGTPNSASSSDRAAVSLASMQELTDDIFNSTLGFEKLFVLNLPERSDHRDTLALTGAVSGFHFDFMDAVHGETIPDKALPPKFLKTMNNAGKGSWRAHSNALRAVIEQNLTTAVILEDDIDWDIRIKQQLYDFAKGTRALIQPLDDLGKRYADPTFPEPSDPNMMVEAMTFDSLPNTQPARVSPYGDNWDLLWLGHCGMRRPVTAMPQPWGTFARRIPKGHVVRKNDNTVPPKRDIHVYNDDDHPGFRHDFPEHTRVVHHSMDAICSLVYAVSQAGARKLLYELAIQRADDLFDIMLRQFCDGSFGHDKHTCVTVQPTLFDHHRPAGQISKDSDLMPSGDGVRDRGFTLNIRWSTRMNIEKLLKGETDYHDSYPDH